MIISPWLNGEHLPFNRIFSELKNLTIETICDGLKPKGFREKFLSLPCLKRKRRRKND